MAWDPEFIERSPMLDPLREVASKLRAHSQWPARRALDALLAERELTTGGGARLHLVPPSSSGESYESRIYLRGEMQYRECEWHDFFNLLTWLVYPRTKRALNAAHHDALTRTPVPTAATGTRGRVRDALTVFDESGVIVVSSDTSLLADVHAFDWKPLFWGRRERVRAEMRFVLFGHAMFEKALRPYVGMTAHALLIPVSDEVVSSEAALQLQSIDALASAEVAALTTPQVLSPLPLLGVPDWWPANEGESFYDNADYFRRGRR
jgi:hypothetical protein